MSSSWLLSGGTDVVCESTFFKRGALLIESRSTENFVGQVWRKGSFTRSWHAKCTPKIDLFSTSDLHLYQIWRPSPLFNNPLNPSHPPNAFLAVATPPPSAPARFLASSAPLPAPLLVLLAFSPHLLLPGLSLSVQHRTVFFLLFFLLLLLVLLAFSHYLLLLRLSLPVRSNCSSVISAVDGRIQSMRVVMLLICWRCKLLLLVIERTSSLRVDYIYRSRAGSY